jgi:hypothetical protein
MNYYFVTHAHSAPSKKRGQNSWDFLAVASTREEAERLVAVIEGATGVKEIKK